jgi:sigma-B regulation protein RsbU (phosphoserine phosphatase)
MNSTKGAADGPRGRALVVDDVEANREVLSRRLERFGHTWVAAKNGVEALAVLAAEGHAIDVVLLDVMMPEMDGMEVLRRVKADETLRHIPVIMISADTDIDRVVECLELGATDYLTKPFNPVILRARVNASVETHRLHQREQAFLQALQDSQELLAAELAEAAAYVRSLLPAAQSPPASTDWSFVPSTNLGGDFLGYHWLDEDRFAIYLLDVSGHGVRAALLSVAVVNSLRSETLPGVDFGNPASVLGGLNDHFPMERHNNMYFTVWYGVYSKSRRRLRYASGGHPPAILVTAEGPRELRTPGFVIGGMPDMTFPADECDVPPGSALYVFSDGAYEVRRPDQTEMTLEDLIAVFTQKRLGGHPACVDVFGAVLEARGSSALEDDVSILRVLFE